MWWETQGRPHVARKAEVAPQTADPESGWQLVSFVDYPLQQARQCGTACRHQVGCDNMMIPLRLLVYLSAAYKSFFSYYSNV